AGVACPCARLRLIATPLKLTANKKTRTRLRDMCAPVTNLLTLGGPGSRPEFAKFSGSFHCAVLLESAGILDVQGLSLCFDLQREFDLVIFKRAGNRCFTERTFVLACQFFTFLFEIEGG